jgi:regulatory protein
MQDPEAHSGPDPQTSAEAVNPAEIRRAAMNLLARREHSLAELRRKLGARFKDEALLEAELQRLSEENLQSDSRYAESFARQRAGRGYGPVRVRQEMREKGLDDAAIADAFQRADLDWYELAEEVYRKKFGLATGDKGHQQALKDKARQARFMQYRGFEPDHYRHLLGE